MKYVQLFGQNINERRDENVNKKFYENNNKISDV